MLTDVERRVLECIDAAEVVERTRALVRIPSVYRPHVGEAEEAAAALVRDWLAEMGLETHWDLVAPGRPNVIGLLKGPNGGRCLMFEGHTDVVTEGEAGAWRHSPFEAALEGGRVYGRGAADMKGGLAAAIMAVKAIVDSGARPGGTILVGALVDEEGQMLGVKHFLETGWAKGVSAAIICEPEDNRLCIAQKGVLWARVTVAGRMAHGAMPHTGINPIYHAGALLRELKALEAEETGRYGHHPFLGKPSITPTTVRAPLHGEPQNNVIPAQCALTLDIRLVPGQSPAAIEAKVRGIFGRLAAADPTFSAEVEVLEARPATATPPEEPIVVALAGAYRDLTGREPTYGGVPGTTDGTLLFARAGIPIVTCGPGDTLIPHQVDEHVDVGQLVEATRLYALAALRYLGVGGT